MKSIISRITVGLALVALAGTAWAEPESPNKDDVDKWVESGDNKDYKPKTDDEGATWTFNPDEINLNQGVSSSGTSFKGARILEGNTDIVVEGAISPGYYNDDKSQRYVYWEGNTLYFGVKDLGSDNSVDAIVEFYWFESSIPRGSDFYVMLVKVKSSPNAWDNWYIAREDAKSWFENMVTFWQDVQPAQHMNVNMEPGGEHGALRWDFSVPFETYKWEPYKTMQIQEEYGAGFVTEAGAGNGDDGDKGGEEAKDEIAAAVNLVSSFAEGGAIMDLTAGLLIQAKGNVNESFKISTQYTVTLHRWMMLVQSGGEEMKYKLAAMASEEDKNAVKEESAYFEYFVVMQAERGKDVHIQGLEIGGQFKRIKPFWFDDFQGLSAVIGDIWITPPPGICLPGEMAPANTCNTKGVCGTVKPYCDDDNNQWYCPVVKTYEAKELTCDNLDNDCDGMVDEYLTQSCTTACGTGIQTCKDGQFSGCTAPQPKPETCDGFDNDCNGKIDDGVQKACETVCGVGIRTCSNGVFGSCDAPQPEVEVCDGIDNDCDGKIDESVFESCSNACGTGQAKCVDGVFTGCDAPQPTAEVCDGIDNDCDGQIDEGITQACNTACGSGIQACSNGAFGACDAPQPTAETCDGIDNNCDGNVDEGLARVCDTACGTGTEVCSNGVFSGCDAPTPEAEICDGMDNNCDGEVDENLVRQCSTACGNGYETCESGSFQSCDAPQPSPEQCGDQVDNDCDGVVDNGCDIYTKPEPEPEPEPEPKDPPSTQPPTSEPPPSEPPATTSPSAPVSGGCAATQSDTVPTMAWVLFLLMGLFGIRRRRHAA